MGRPKVRPKIDFKPTALECFFSIAAMPSWAERLYEEQGEQSVYHTLLEFLIDKRFYVDDEKITISKISKEAVIDSSKVSKWLKGIYQEIFLLNQNKPVLFQKKSELKVTINCSYFDEFCYLYISLPVIPRVGDTFRFPFVKAKVGTDYFFVHKIFYDLENDCTEITVSLKGGIHNQYRDFALAKAEFEGHLSLQRQLGMLDIEIDEILRGRSVYYKNNDYKD